MVMRRYRRSLLLTCLMAMVTAIASGAFWFLQDSWRTDPHISGYARILDGDSLIVGKTEVRLYGVDAPELVQRCQREGRDMPCGREAMRNLVALVGGQQVICEKKTIDRFHRVVARCMADQVDLGQAMVLSGQAVAFGHYQREEEAAKTERKGLWAGEFVRPQDWRRQEGNRPDASR